MRHLQPFPTCLYKPIKPHTVSRRAQQAAFGWRCSYIYPASGVSTGPSVTVTVAVESVCEERNFVKKPQIKIFLPCLVHMSHFPLFSPLTCFDVRSKCLTSGPEKQNHLVWLLCGTWVSFFFSVFFSYAATVCPLFALLHHRLRQRPVHLLPPSLLRCVSSLLAAVDITGLYKVIKRAKRWIPPEMPQMPVCQA